MKHISGGNQLFHQNVEKFRLRVFHCLALPPNLLLHAFFYSFFFSNTFLGYSKLIGQHDDSDSQRKTKLKSAYMGGIPTRTTQFSHGKS